MDFRKSDYCLVHLLFSDTLPVVVVTKRLVECQNINECRMTKDLKEAAKAFLKLQSI